MKTKMTAAAFVVAVAIAATAVAANLFGSARTIPLPIQGDPIPGVDVSIEQSPPQGIIIKGQTGRDGNATFAKVTPGHVVIQCASISTSRSNVKHPPGLIVVSAGGGVRGRGQWADTSKPFKLEIVLEGRESQKLVVNVTEGK